MFDPFITPNDKAKDRVNIKDIQADFILLSHAHYDHIADAVEIGKATDAHFICNYELSSWLKDEGIEKMDGMNTGGNKRFDWGNVKFVNALHSSSFQDGRYGGVPGGFVIETEEGNFYYAGDTALSTDFQLIGEWYDLDFAFLPIGDYFTMGTEDAVVCSDFIQCDNIIGMHYDTFPQIEIDHQLAKSQFSDAGKQLHLMEIGAILEL